MANAPTYNIEIDQGSDYELDLRLEINDQAYHLDALDIYATFRESYTSPQYVEFTVEYLDESDGYFRLSMPAYKSDQITATSGYYDVEIHTGDGQKIRVLQGTVKVNRSVTTQRQETTMAINLNTDELVISIVERGESNTAYNVGSGAEVYKDKTVLHLTSVLSLVALMQMLHKATTQLQLTQHQIGAV